MTDMSYRVATYSTIFYCNRLYGATLHKQNSLLLSVQTCFLTKFVKSMVYDEEMKSVKN